MNVHDYIEIQGSNFFFQVLLDVEKHQSHQN